MIEKCKLFTAINNYTEAVWQLSKAMSEVKAESGRKTLEDITPFDLTKIRTLCKLGENTHLSGSLTAEHAVELLGETRKVQSQMIKFSISNSLKPSQLRREVRKRSAKETVVEKTVKVSTWGKHLILLSNELKNMDGETKKRALAHLTNTILQ